MLHVPTDEELSVWAPDPAQKRFRIECNVATGEVKQIELTINEYRARYRAKMVSQNEREARDLAEQQKEADRQAGLKTLRRLGLEEKELKALFG